MTKQLRASRQTFRVLDALLREPARWRYGYALSREARLLSGTLYPILMRLEKRGWLEARWERPPRSERGHPPRHMYRLTADGRAWAKEALKAVAAHPQPRIAYGKA